MNAESIFCGACSALLPQSLTERQKGLCSACGTATQVKTFPALFAVPKPVLPQSLQDQAEASCFYHEQNRASVPCGECGRFLCQLCALDIPGKTVCPSCLDTSVSARKIEGLEHSRVMHESIALALATIPAMLFWPVLVSAPLAIFWAIRHWKSPRSIVPRSRIRLYLAILFGLAEIAFAALVIVGVVRALRLQQ